MSGYVSSGNVFDPHKTAWGPLYGFQSLVFSRLLTYVSQADGSMVADLAEALPQQPDAQTFVFKLKEGARWPDGTLGGRAVTSADVKASIDRQMAGDTSFVRKASWLIVDSIGTPTEREVVFKLKEPFANMLGLFAAVNSFIVPQELAANEIGRTQQLGSGPFRWVDWKEDGFASVGRNGSWHGGNGRPYMDGVSVVQLKNTAEVEAKLRTNELDTAVVGRPLADRLEKALPELQELSMGTSLFYGMRFSVRQAPYNDSRFRAAVSAAIDRREMLQQFFAGSGDVNPWISWPMKRWTLPHAELSNIAGYRPGSGGRDADIKEAKELLAAVAGAQTLPVDYALFVPDDAESTLHLGSVVSEQLARTLGLKVTVYPMPIADLSRRLLTGDAPWAVGPDSGWIDLDDWLYPYFHSAGTKNSFPLRDPDLDALIAAQRSELDEGKRREIGLQAQRKLLSLNAAINFVSERVITLAWPYVRNLPVDTADGYQHRFADCWIDRGEPSFKLR